VKNAQFEWDDEKAWRNVANHRVTFEEATEVFGPGYSFAKYDDAHSVSEDRFMIIGYSSRGRLLAVWHTHRAGRVRIIGARLATPAERKSYEENRNQRP
jgi:uncharacterized DUF497 family protein